MTSKSSRRGIAIGVAAAAVVLVLAATLVAYLGSRPARTTTALPTAKASAAQTAQPGASSAPLKFASPEAAADALALTVDSLTYTDSAGQNQPCAKRLETRRGTHAASVGYAFGSCPGEHGGAGGAAYVFEDSTGWHAYTVMASQNGALPGGEGPGFYGLAAGHGCMKVRQGPSAAAPTVTCLAGGQPLATTGLPTWADGHIWYQMRSVNTKDLTLGETLGWSMLDYLACGQPPRPGAAQAPDC